MYKLVVGQTWPFTISVYAGDVVIAEAPPVTTHLTWNAAEMWLRPENAEQYNLLFNMVARANDAG